ncbi:MAG: GH3 auxin-responsive promoter family protein [Spirulina sp. SIO3F2]|nr:GH3 auxin-responsive promoter family protein [Spirulina sp. SIO3F2]
MANLLLNLIGTVAQQARRRFIRQTQHTQDVQTQFLRSLLQLNSQTALGRDLGLPGIKTVEEFRAQVPISRYSDYEAYVQRAFEGEANVMTPDPVIYFSLTSGSTGRQKLLPITKRSRQAVSRANQIAMGVAAYTAQQRGRALDKMLFTNSAKPYGYSPQGIAYGPISVGDINLLGPIYQRVFAHPVTVLRVKDSLTRNYLAMLFALGDRHLGIVSATFPIYALTFCQYLDKHATELLEDLEAGTLADWLDLEPELRQQLLRQRRPNPERAKELRTIVAVNGGLYPKDAWPNLAFIVTARGGPSGFYFERFPEYFGDLPIFGGTYASAEATYGVHRDFGTDGVILSVNSGFYEFIPESEWEVEQPQTVLPHELQVGDRYRILVTTLSGLYRYDVGDVVEVEGFYNTAPIFTFRYRYGGMLSAVTEKTTEYHLLTTMKQLQQEFKLQLENFCVTLAKDLIPPHYLVNIELAAGQTLAEPEQFLRRFDAILAEVHVSYGTKRPDPVPYPRLRILAPGSYDRLRQQAIDRGVLESQIKFPHLTEDRDYLDGIVVEQEFRMDE